MTQMYARVFWIFLSIDASLRFQVRYFSVASRKDRSKFGILHPLWFPKLVVDGVAESSPPPLPPSSTYSDLDIEGNDGLVPVSSAIWGELLGIVENCDHWEIRGVGGLRKLSFNLGGSLGDALSLDRVMSLREWKLKRKEDGTQTIPTNGKENNEREKHEKALTDQLSAVVDWIVDRSPAQIKGLGNSGVPPAVQGVEKEQEKEKKWDLERFYVALCRKLYDEGDVNNT